MLCKNCVAGRICVKFQNVILTVCFCPNIFVSIIARLFRSQVIVFTNIHLCYILSLCFVHNSYEFALLLANS